MRRLLKAETSNVWHYQEKHCCTNLGDHRQSPPFSSQLGEECIVFLSEHTQDPLVSLILGLTLNASKGQFADAVDLFILTYR